MFCQPLPRVTRRALRGLYTGSPSRDGTSMAALPFASIYLGAQSMAGFKGPPVSQQHAIISGSMIIASTENCTKYLPNDEDCREAGKLPFSLCLKKHCNLSLCLRFQELVCCSEQRCWSGLAESKANGTFSQPGTSGPL